MRSVINALGRMPLDALLVWLMLARLTDHVCATATFTSTGQLVRLVMLLVPIVSGLLLHNALHAQSIQLCLFLHAPAILRL